MKLIDSHENEMKRKESDVNNNNDKREKKKKNDNNKRKTMWKMNRSPIMK